MVERIAVSLREEHELEEQKTKGDHLSPQEELLEEIKIESSMRRWNEINFCKRLRAMRE